MPFLALFTGCILTLQNPAALSTPLAQDSKVTALHEPPRPSPGFASLLLSCGPSEGPACAALTCLSCMPASTPGTWYGRCKRWVLPLNSLALWRFISCILLTPLSSNNICLYSKNDAHHVTGIYKSKLNYTNESMTLLAGHQVGGIQLFAWRIHGYSQQEIVK